MTDTKVNSSPTEAAPPHDKFAERAVLGCIMIDPPRIAEVAEVVQPSAFYVGVHRTIYRRMLGLHAAGRPVDATLIAGAMRDAGELDELGDSRGVLVSDLRDLLDLMPTPVHCTYYVERVLELAYRRQQLQRGLRIVSAAQRNDPTSARRRTPTPIAIEVTAGGSHD